MLTMYPTLPERLALSGKMATGKTTLAQLFVKQSGFTVVSIGAAIKSIATALVQKDRETLSHLLHPLIEEEAHKRTIMTELERVANPWHPSRFVVDANGVFVKNEPYRLLLQAVATYMRATFGQAVWVNYLIRKYEHDTPIIIDDMRLQMEKDILEKNGYVCIRLNIDPTEQRRRLENEYGSVNEESLLHPTEVDLDACTFVASVDVSHLSPEDVFVAFSESLQALQPFD